MRPALMKNESPKLTITRISVRLDIRTPSQGGTTECPLTPWVILKKDYTVKKPEIHVFWSHGWLTPRAQLRFDSQ